MRYSIPPGSGSKPGRRSGQRRSTCARFNVYDADPCSGVITKSNYRNRVGECLGIFTFTIPADIMK